MAEDAVSEKPTNEIKSLKNVVGPDTVPASVNGDTTMESNGDSANAVEKMSTKVSVFDVLKSPNLDDAGKFDVFRGLVEGGKLTNKEVVNSILHLVRRESLFAVFNSNNPRLDRFYRILKLSGLLLVFYRHGFCVRILTQNIVL